MLTLNTQIPTAARPQIRALIKGHADWQAFITGKGKLRAQALNADLLEFALRYKALTAQVENILRLAPLGSPTNGPAIMADDPVIMSATKSAADEEAGHSPWIAG